MSRRYGGIHKHVTARHDAIGVQIAWTDGACEPNPGIGGWGVVIECDGNITAEYSGGEHDTTNNRMEMVAVIEAIERTTGSLIIRTDSQLVLLCAVGRWKRKANTDLWARYDRAANGRNINLEWWRGHIGTPGNERADFLAGSGRLMAESSVQWIEYDLSNTDRQHMREIIRGHDLVPWE